MVGSGLAPGPVRAAARVKGYLELRPFAEPRESIDCREQFLLLEKSEDECVLAREFP